jgi:FkbM family methyltransferase
MKSRIARELRRFAERLDNADYSRARALGIPWGTYSVFRRAERIASIAGVLDIGANRGQFAFWASSYFTSVPIHCFEPLPACLEALQKIASERKNVIVHPFALGEADGAQTMNLNDYSPSSSLLRMTERHKEIWPKTKNEKPIEIAVKRLDSFSDQFKAPLFLKFDVQGYELHVLRGAENVLKKAAVLQLEVLFEPLYEGQPDFRAVMNFLAERGFTFVDFADERRLGPDRDLVYADAIFVADAYRQKAKPRA